MPIYLYEHLEPVQCAHWGNDENGRFEVDQSIKSEPLTKCPRCEQPVKRLIAGSVYVTWKGGAPTSKSFS